MSPSPSAPLEAQALMATGVRFSICTLVTRPDQYRDMLASFRAHGFGEDDCEFIQIDNSRGNSLDAYQGVNLFLTVARGEYVILCHQDIVLVDNRSQLEACLADLGRRDPHWALCGNSGGMSLTRQAIRISDPLGEDQRTADFPARVFALDENFILARRAANLAVSADLKGFHLYGADLCVVADVLGCSAWVIDFHVRHLSAGTRDASLTEARRAMVEKYIRAFRGRWVRAPCELMYLSGRGWLSRVLSVRMAMKIARRLGPGR